MAGNLIVIGYDGSAGARQALGWASREAARTRDRLELVYAWRWPEYLPAATMIPGTPVWPDLTAEADLAAMLERAAGRVRAEVPGVPVGTRVAHGPPAAVLRESSAGARLLVVGGRSHGALAGFLLGSVAGAMTAHAACTTVVARDGPPPDPAARIVLGLDESAAADRTAAFAFEQAAAQGATVHVVRAWMPPPDPWIGSRFTDREEIAVAEQVAVRERVQPCTRTHPSVRVRIDTVAGHPYRVIADAAAGARMVVLGARGGGGFPGLRLGSVTRYVLHHVPATVAVVR